MSVQSSTGPAGAIPPPPSRTLLQRLPDLLLWGAVIVLLIVAFGPAEINKLPLLFSKSENMQQFGSEFLRPDFTEIRTVPVGQCASQVLLARVPAAGMEPIDEPQP